MVMTVNSTQVLVFKTHVYSDQDMFRVEQALEGLREIEEWHVDREDVDRVLRVVAHDVGPEDVIHRLKAAGIDCCELNW